MNDSEDFKVTTPHLPFHLSCEMPNIVDAYIVIELVQWIESFYLILFYYRFDCIHPLVITYLTISYRSVTDLLCVFQEGQSRCKDQIDGTGMSLDNKKGVRVTGKYVPTVNWSRRGSGPSIVHYSTSTQISPDAPALISIGPLPPKSPEQFDDPRIEEPAAGEDWTRVASSQSRVVFGETGVSQQTMEELKTVLRDSPLLRGRDDGKPGSPYTYLHGNSSSSGGGPGKQQGEGNPYRAFSTFKPQSDASRRGPRSSDNTPIQLPSNMDSSSSFRSDANTNRLPGVRTYAHTSGSSWRGTGDSCSG